MNKTQNIVVTGFIFFSGEVLVVKRSSHKKFMPDKWELPGGKVDWGEDIKIALKRELQEETSLEVQVYESFRVFGYVNEETDVHTVEIVYFTRLKGNPEDVELSDEHQEYKWISAEDVDAYFPQGDLIRESVTKGFDILKKING